MPTMVNSHETTNSSENARLHGRKMYWVAVTLCIIASVGGRSAGSLLGRYYFHEGGHSYWLRTLLTSVGSPLLILPLLLNGPTQYSSFPTRSLKIKYLSICTLLGILVAANNFLYSLGFYYLPVSTFSLLCATQLAFTAVFSIIFVKQRISHYVINSLVLITLGAVLLGIQAKGERPGGVKSGEYKWGILSTILGSALYGFIHPLLQFVFKKLEKSSFAMVLETQALICMVASGVAAVGLMCSGEFKHISKEAHHFRAGERGYVLTLLWSAISWQMCVVGTYGLVSMVSSLFSMVVSTLTLPILPVLALLLFDDKINSLKVIGMVLGIWGFVSYAYGGYQESKKAEEIPLPASPV
ncbi:probable purine permease 11 [Cryptomeria japonica]|uniref:probable purine permease 11 n=1 Tax=Cryptomeria japonica TaxID=3369 RepID=UPI0027D9E8E9|nr:probable purine permease 11 [Cryptomeria japonica]